MLLENNKKYTTGIIKFILLVFAINSAEFLYSSTINQTKIDYKSMPNKEKIEKIKSIYTENQNISISGLFNIYKMLIDIWDNSDDLVRSETLTEKSKLHELIISKIMTKGRGLKINFDTSSMWPIEYCNNSKILKKYPNGESSKLFVEIMIRELDGLNDIFNIYKTIDVGYTIRTSAGLTRIDAVEDKMKMGLIISISEIDDILIKRYMNNFSTIRDRLLPRKIVDTEGYLEFKSVEKAINNIMAHMGPKFSLDDRILLIELNQHIISRLDPVKNQYETHIFTKQFITEIDSLAAELFPYYSDGIGASLVAYERRKSVFIAKLKSLKKDEINIIMKQIGSRKFVEHRESGQNFNILSRAKARVIGDIQDAFGINN